jgi:hypothetical protein
MLEVFNVFNQGMKCLAAFVTHVIVPTVISLAVVMVNKVAHFVINIMDFHIDNTFYRQTKTICFII